VTGGLDQPLGVTAPADGSGRLFVIERTGRIRIVQGGVLQAQPFLDVSSLVTTKGSEQGLLGLAFHPRYAENGRFYVNYTDTNGDTVVARYQVSADPNVADPTTATQVLFQQQPYANHNGGNLVFGPDGYLWIGLGDGGSGGDPQDRAQNVQTWLGKLLRIDVDSGELYVSPADNLAAANPDAWPEIWAYGLRNPWRFSFDRATNDLYIGDVGQNAYEEIDFVPAGTGAGLNFGWNRMEGAHCYNSPTCDPAPYVLPVAEYAHSEGCSITGGFVYRGSAYPRMDGAYLSSDYCSGTIWALTRSPDGSWANTVVLRSKANVSSFGEDEAGELYLTDLQGTLYRVTAP
jgi:glucose/arabinose dehydrogenase